MSASSPRKLPRFKQVRVWGGEVTITGQPGSGTTVTVRLPTDTIAVRGDPP